MKKFHIAIGVKDIGISISEYTKRLGQKPVFIQENEYALWRTETLNFSIRKSDDPSNTIRHLGWEDPDAKEFSEEKDVNGIIWEHFSAEQQATEIRDLWTESQYFAEIDN